VTDTRTLTARWVFPVSGPPLPCGTVTVRGETIEAVHPRGERTADEDLGNVALVPGLVNAHTHLDLTGARGQIQPTDPDHFTDWLRGVIAYRRTRSPEQTAADIRAGLAECLRFGTTLVGDISSDGESWDAVAGANTRAVVFREMIGVTTDRAVAADTAARQWLDAHPDTATCRTGVSPHAPYSAVASLFLVAGVWKRVAATHVAEAYAEREFLREGTGAFADFLAGLGLPAPEGRAETPEQVLALLRKPPRVVVAHANYVWRGRARDFTPNQSVAYCPRTHAAFKHWPHPFREFLARGVRVCLGTDSLASNPDLDILAEARFVHAKYPDFPGDQLLRMVTLAGADALGWADECGSLEAGKSADVVAVPLPDRDAADPHELLFSDFAGDRRTMFRGDWRA
jgi:cytosine/adenosine deaminase-related metal-dependent hydrolase